MFYYMISQNGDLSGAGVNGFDSWLTSCMAYGKLFVLCLSFLLRKTGIRVAATSEVILYAINEHM